MDELRPSNFKMHQSRDKKGGMDSLGIGAGYYMGFMCVGSEKKATAGFCFCFCLDLRRFGAFHFSLLWTFLVLGIWL